ncbi:MAG: restriction endonuclease subunit S [Anaerolineae bacterium]
MIPPLPEQRAIAHILGTLDDKIALNRRLSATLEELRGRCSKPGSSISSRAGQAGRPALGQRAGRAGGAVSRAAGAVGAGGDSGGVVGGQVGGHCLSQGRTHSGPASHCAIRSDNGRARRIG